MTKSEYQKINKLLKSILEEVEIELISENPEMDYEEIKEVMKQAKYNALVNLDIEPQEYFEYEEALKNIGREKGKQKKDSFVNQIKDSIIPEKIEVPTSDDIRKLAKEVIPQPVNTVINKIVKEIVKEKPITNVIKETTIEKEIDRTALDEFYKDIQELQTTYHDTLKEIEVSKDFMAGFDGKVEGKVKDLISPELNRIARSFQSQIFSVNKKVDDIEPSAATWADLIGLPTDNTDLTTYLSGNYQPKGDYFNLDQTVSQTVFGGMPVFSGGLSTAFGSKVTNGTESLTFEDYYFDASGTIPGLQFYTPTLKSNYNAIIDNYVLGIRSDFAIIAENAEEFNFHLIRLNTTLNTMAIGNINVDISGNLNFSDGFGMYTLAQLASSVPFTGTEGSVLFVGADTNITEDNSNFFWDNTNKQMMLLSEPTPCDGFYSVPFLIRGKDEEGYVGLVVYNRGSGQYSSADVVVANDIDDGTVETGVYGDFGIGSSNYFYPGTPLVQPNGTYLNSVGGDLNIFTLTPGKVINIATGGNLADNARISITDTQMNVISNKEADAIPTLEAVNWTATYGFSAGSGFITCVSDVNISTIEPSASTWVVAGTTYLVTIVVDAASGSIGYTIGGTSGSAITTGTIQEYITATTTGKLIFIAQAGATCTISSIIVRALVNDTGNLFVEGDITLGSELKTTTGASILTSNGLGVATFASIPLLPATDPTLDNEAVRKAYVDAVSQGLYPTFNCRVATTTAGNLNTDFENGDTIDGVTLATGDYILIKNQADNTENGFYEVQASGAPSRIAPYTTGNELLRGTYTAIDAGSVNIRSSWVMYAANATIDTDPILFRQTYTFQEYTASNGVQKVALDFQIDLSDTNPSLEIEDGGLRALVDDSSIERSASGLRVKALGITDTMLAGSIPDSKLDQITTADKVSGASLTSLASIPSGAGVIPIANLATGTPTGTKYVRDDGTLAVPPGGGAGTVDSVVAGDNIVVDNTDPANPIVSSSWTGATPYAETPTGTINGSNKVFTLAHTPTYNSNVMILLDGVMQYNGSDYTVSGVTVTFISAPATGSTIFVYYNSLDAVGTPAVFAGFSRMTLSETNVFAGTPTYHEVWFHPE